MTLSIRRTYADGSEGYLRFVGIQSFHHYHDSGVADPREGNYNGPCIEAGITHEAVFECIYPEHVCDVYEVEGETYTKTGEEKWDAWSYQTRIPLHREFTGGAIKLKARDGTEFSVLTWKWDGDEKFPSLSPSINSNQEIDRGPMKGRGPHWHIFLKHGVIDMLSDSNMKVL